MATDRPRKRRSDAGVKRVDSEYRTFSFRLNLERDADVIAKIDDFISQRDDDGKYLPLHLLIIDALRGGQTMPRMNSNVLEFFNEQLQRLDETIERLNEMGVTPKQKSKATKSGGISASYLSNLKKALHGEDE